MSNTNSQLKRESETVGSSRTQVEEPLEPNEAEKGGGADKSKALGEPGLGDRGKVSLDEDKYD